MPDCATHAVLTNVHADMNQWPRPVGDWPEWLFTASSVRPARHSTRASFSSRTSPLGYDAKAVRSWGASNDIPVPARGRIPGAVLERRRAAGH